MPEFVRPDGLVVITDEQEATTVEPLRTPDSACYVMGQFARVMLDAARESDHERPFTYEEPIISDQGNAITAMRNVTLEACSRACVESCRLRDIVAADESALQIELGISEEDTTLLRNALHFLVYVEPGDEDGMGRQASWIKRVIDTWLRVAVEQSQEATEGQFQWPEIEDPLYQMLGNLTEGNLHVIKSLVAHLLEISDLQRIEGVDAARSKYGISFDRTGVIGIPELRKLLLHADQGYQFALNLKSTPRSQIFKA